MEVAGGKERFYTRDDDYGRPRPYLNEQEGKSEQRVNLHTCASSSSTLPGMPLMMRATSGLPKVRFDSTHSTSPR